MIFLGKLAVVISFVTSLIILLITIPPASPVDTFYHLSLGREIFETKVIPKEDNFIYGADDKAITPTEWLSGLIFFLPVKYFDLNGLLVVRMLAGITTFYFLIKTLSLVSQNNFINSSVFLIITFLLTPRFNDRPEIFSFAFLALINYVSLKLFLHKEISKFTLILPLIFLLWPNMHAFSPIGLIIFSVMFLLSLLTHKIKHGKNFKILTAILLLSVFASFIQLNKFFFGFKGLNIGESVIEMFSIGTFYKYYGLFGLSLISNVVYLLLTTAFIIVIILFLIKTFKDTSQKPLSKLTTLIFVLIYLGIILSPFKHLRLIPISFLLTLPVFLFILSTLLRKQHNKIMPPITFVTTFIIVVGFTIQSPVSNLYHEFQIKITRSKSFLAYWEQQFPTKIPPVINKYLNSKRISAGSYWNSYFIWSSPQAKVFSDVVYETATTQSISDEITISSGTGNWANLLQKYAIDTVINNQPDSQFGAYTPVYKLDNWKLIYLDNTAALYARQDIISSTPVNLSVIHPEMQGDLKFKPEDETEALRQLEDLLDFDPTNDFARVQLIIYWKDKNTPKAERLALESHKILPQNPWFSFLLTSINAKNNDCKSAKKFAKETKEKSLGDTHVILLTQKAVDKCGIKI